MPNHPSKAHNVQFVRACYPCDALMPKVVKVEVVKSSRFNCPPPHSINGTFVQQEDAYDMHSAHLFKDLASRGI